MTRASPMFSSYLKSTNESLPLHPVHNMPELPFNASPVSLATSLALLVLLIHVVPWLLDPHGVRSIPGPFLAKFSDAWLGWMSAHGHRSEVVHEMHKKYGKLNHPSLPYLVIKPPPS
jgi:hypothetical protein